MTTPLSREVSYHLLKARAQKKAEKLNTKERRKTTFGDRRVHHYVISTGRPLRRWAVKTRPTWR